MNGCDTKKEQGANQTQTPIENILSRKSVRKYTDQPVEKEKVQLLLRAAMAAPSGKDNKAHYNEGTMSLAGSGGSMPFAPEEVEASLAYYYRILQGKLVGKYGLYDSYNLENNDVWIAKDVIGIDKGISLLMIENYRSEIVWKYFMQSDVCKRAIEVLDFTSVEESYKDFIRVTY